MKKIVLLFFVFVITVAGCSRGSKEPVARLGDPAPEFTATTVTGTEVSLKGFKGRPLVVTFMAEWCPCSNESAPVFKEAYNAYGPRGVGFVMFGFQDSKGKFQSFVERHAFQFPAAYDSGDSIGSSFGVMAPPTTFFITPDGKIQRMFYGKIDKKDDLFRWIDELLSKSGADKKSAAKDVR